jgi:hypothetical protein
MGNTISNKKSGLIISKKCALYFERLEVEAKHIARKKQN